MNPHLPEEASGFGAAAEKAFAAHGGVDLARAAQSDPTARDRDVAPLLRSLGVDDLDPREDLDTAAAAGELCRAAGRVALPYPLAAALLRDRDGNPTAVTAGGTAAMVDHGDLFETWRLVGIGGAPVLAAPAGERLGSRLGPFVCPLLVRREAVGHDRSSDAALSMALSAWRILGFLQGSLDLAVAHVRDREQFGQKLAEFQAVQFQLADAAVAVAGLEELCRFTTWRAWAAPDAFLTDSLALRLYALETSRSVLRTAQQLHGAAGVCDEYDVSVLATHVQADLRLPFGAATTASRLATAVEQQGFEALFAQGGRAG